jgi:murein tripeptide amidase MpaA
MRRNWTSHVSLVALAAALAGCGHGSLPGAAGVRQSGVQANSFTTSRQVVRIQFKDAAQLEALERAGVDLFENVNHDTHTVGASLTAASEAVLKKLGVRYQLLLGAEAETRGAMPAGYQTVDQIYAGMKKVAESHTSFARQVEIGKSLEGRPIYAINFTSKPGKGLPSVRINSGQHARELPPVELSFKLINLLADGYGKDQTITRLVDTRDIWIVPIVNPDGRTKVQEGSSMWRKNARPLSGGNAGVDTNRNADDHWSQGNNSQWADDYHGAAPFSEPESAAVRDLCDKMRFKASIDVHNYAGMILWPPGYSTEFTKDEERFKAVGTKMASPLRYRAGTIARTIYKTYGDLSTWEYAKYGTLAFGAELADSRFNAPIAEMERDWQGWQPNFLYLMDVAGNPAARHPQEAPKLPMVGLSL